MHLTAAIFVSAFLAVAGGATEIEKAAEKAARKATSAGKAAPAKKLEGPEIVRLHTERKEAREKLIAATDGGSQLAAANAFVTAGDQLLDAGMRNAGHGWDFVDGDGKSLKGRTEQTAFLSVTDHVDGTKFLLKIHSPYLTTQLTMDR